MNSIKVTRFGRLKIFRDGPRRVVLLPGHSISPEHFLKENWEAEQIKSRIRRVVVNLGKGPVVFFVKTLRPLETEAQNMGFADYILGPVGEARMAMAVRKKGRQFRLSAEHPLAIVYDKDAAHVVYRDVMSPEQPSINRTEGTVSIAMHSGEDLERLGLTPGDIQAIREPVERYAKRGSKGRRRAILIDFEFKKWKGMTPEERRSIATMPLRERRGFLPARLRKYLIPTSGFEGYNRRLGGKRVEKYKKE